jgi:sugar phosphate isomerase/epimerase
MKLPDGAHLAYCTNIHPAETWEETFAALRSHTLAVRERVSPRGEPFAIGLRLSDHASRELVDPAALTALRQWLDRHAAYVFTINGFPYGSFHGRRVKEQVYAPDWTSPDRLAYTTRLFDILAALVPEGVAGSVSTLPGSFKEFLTSPAQLDAIHANLRACAAYIEALSERAGPDLHLGLEPEPLGLFETTPETIRFLDELLDGQPAAWRRILGVNYDTCHLAVEYEDAAASLTALADAGIRLSKLHLSSALALEPTAEARERLRDFADDIYLHQVVARRGGEITHRHRDLPDALGDATAFEADEWRVHFHIPLHAAPGAPFRDTRDHLVAALAWLRAHPGACEHWEMETYTWSVLPADLKSSSVVDQLVREYKWTLAASA